MNQELKTTIEILLDECFILAKIATTTYTPHLSREEDGTYCAQCYYTEKGHPTAVEALSALKKGLFEKAVSKKAELQNKARDLQQQIDGLNAAAVQLDAVI
jgi:hypothetical protein